MNASLPVYLGQPGVRDPDNVCDAFTPGKPGLHSACNTDGHYLCDSCHERKTCAGCGQRPMLCACLSCSRCRLYPPGSVCLNALEPACQCTNERCAECRQLHRFCECEHDIEVPYSC
jgi:hypothetical protein